jgi:hypothetical protein
MKADHLKTLVKIPVQYTMTPVNKNWYTERSVRFFALLLIVGIGILIELLQKL